MTRLERAVRAMVTDHPSGQHPPAGAAIGVIDGERREVAVSGLTAPGGSPLTRETAHDLASVTKVVATTASLIRLVSDGRVGLDEEVSRYVPAFRGGQKDGVRVRDLLLHRGGLAEWHPLYLTGRDRADLNRADPDRADLDRDGAIRIAAEAPLRYAPDTARHYSDLGFILLGRVIETAFGDVLDRAVEALVLEPLGMSSTRFAHPVGTDVAASAPGDEIEMMMVETGQPYPVSQSVDDFTGWRRAMTIGDVADGNAFHAMHGVSGHAGLFSTVDDLLRFGSALARYREREDLWRVEVVEEFFKPGPDAGQSLGFRLYPFSSPTGEISLLGHTGFVGCAVGFLPGGECAVALCSNRLLGAAPLVDGAAPLVDGAAPLVGGPAPLVGGAAPLPDGSAPRTIDPRSTDSRSTDSLWQDAIAAAIHPGREDAR